MAWFWHHFLSILILIDQSLRSILLKVVKDGGLGLLTELNWESSKVLFSTQISLQDQLFYNNITYRPVLLATV